MSEVSVEGVRRLKERIERVREGVRRAVAEREAVASNILSVVRKHGCSDLAGLRELRDARTRELGEKVAEAESLCERRRRLCVRRAADFGGKRLADQVRRVYSYEEMLRDIDGLVPKVSAYAPDLILGISRGGLAPALYLSHGCGIEFFGFHGSLRDFPRWDALPGEGLAGVGRVLVVDDICDSGSTFEKLSGQMGSLRCEVRFLALWYNAACGFPLDFYSHRIDKSVEDVWVDFPWESFGYAWRERRAHQGV